MQTPGRQQVEVRSREDIGGEGSRAGQAPKNGRLANKRGLSLDPEL